MKSIPDWKLKLRVYFDNIGRSEILTMPAKTAVEKVDDVDSDDELENQFGIIDRESKKSALQTQTKNNHS